MRTIGRSRTSRANTLASTANPFPAACLTALALVIGACSDSSDPAGPGNPTTAPITSVELSNQNITLDGARATTQVGAVARDAQNRMVSGEQSTWTSDDETIAYVASDGTVTALRNGSTMITATTDGIPDDASVTVAAVVGKPYWTAAVLPPGCTSGCVNAGTAMGPDGTIYVATLAGEVLTCTIVRETEH